MLLNTELTVYRCIFIQQIPVSFIDLQTPEIKPWMHQTGASQEQIKFISRPEPVQIITDILLLVFWHISTWRLLSSTFVYSDLNQGCTSSAFSFLLLIPTSANTSQTPVLSFSQGNMRPGKTKYKARCDWMNVTDSKTLKFIMILT